MKPTFVWRLVKRVAFAANVRPLPCSCATRGSRHEPGCRRSVSGENLSSVTPHTLRRTFATDLLNRGLRIEVVSQLLGHASVATTQKAYAELLAETARRELMQTLGYCRDEILGGTAQWSPHSSSSCSSSRSSCSSDMPRSSSSNHESSDETGAYFSYSAAA
jgi:hypothetical protein